MPKQSSNLFENGATVTKRHKTLYGTLSKLLHEREIHDAKLTAFLPSMANLKAIADYETGDSSITTERAEAAIKAATHFCAAIAQIASGTRN